VVVQLYTVGRCKIRDWRKRNNLTQEQLASRAGVSQTMISKYENKEEIPSLRNLKKIATVFNCPIDDLYEWDFIVPVKK
jgi:transcriptional regulator with XRE-family HTH domain